MESRMLLITSGWHGNRPSLFDAEHLQRERGRQRGLPCQWKTYIDVNFWLASLLGEVGPHFRTPIQSPTTHLAVKPGGGGH